MKVKDKRNRNKMKVAKRTSEFKDVQKLYSHPDGPYRVVSIVPLGGDSRNYFEEYVNRDKCNLFYSEKHRTNFLFQLTDTFDEFKLGYICRASDIVVFFIDSVDIDDSKLRVVKRFVPSCVFCVANHGLKVAARRFVNKHFPKEKVVDVGGLVDVLSTIQVRNTSVSRRPHIVPTRVLSDGEFIHVEGFVKKGFVSNKVIVNGKYEMTIEEVVAGEVYSGEQLNGGVDIGNGDSVWEDREDDECSLISEDEGRCSQDENDPEDSSIECGLEEHDEEQSEGHESLISKYSAYRGIRNFSTCDFRSYNFPCHYRDLVFFDDQRRVEKLVTGRSSVVPDNQMVSIKLRYEGWIEEEVFVVFGCYGYEDRKTVYNFHFDSSIPMKEERVVVDFGHRVVEVEPMLTRNLNQKVFKRQDELDSGVISFIAPISFNVSRILIYSKSSPNELSSSSLVSTGLNGFSGDRIIFDEAVLRGIPIKTKKRYSIIKRMFNTKEEVMYFRNIQLHTSNRKVTGFIKKPIGTHGLFKGYFTQPVRSGDKISMFLYKRVFLRDQ